MIARVVDLGGRPMSAVFDTVSGADRDYFNERFTDYVERANNRTEVHLARARETLKQLTSDRMSDALVYIGTAENRLGLDFIVRPSNYPENVNSRTARYLVCNPSVRELLRKNRCDGFSELIAARPITNRSLPYLDAIDGVVHVDKNVVRVTNVMYSSSEDKLSTPERLRINHIWKDMDRKLAEGIDPTDTDGGLL